MTVLPRHGLVNSNHGPAHTHVWRHSPKEQLAFKTQPGTVLPPSQRAGKTLIMKKNFIVKLKIYHSLPIGALPLHGLYALVLLASEHQTHS